jgi:hypothetical protein
MIALVIVFAGCAFLFSYGAGISAFAPKGYAEDREAMVWCLILAFMLLVLAIFPYSEWVTVEPDWPDQPFRHRSDMPRVSTVFCALLALCTLIFGVTTYLAKSKRI